MGCYPIRLAYELFCSAGGGAADPDDVHVDACSAVTEGEVEVDAAGIVGFGPARRLLLTCGFKRSYDTFTSILGSQGQLRLTNPFHPGPADTLTILRPKADPVVERPTTDERSFTAAIRHIHAVLRGGCLQRSWYTRLIDRIAGTITGVTRDACFLIENGRLTTPVGGMRFTEPVPGALAGVEAVGSGVRSWPITNVWNGAVSAPAARSRVSRLGVAPIDGAW